MLPGQRRRQRCRAAGILPARRRYGTSISSAASVVKFTDHGTLIADQKFETQFGSSDDLFIIHYSLAIERSARNRNYSPSLGRWINQDPAGYVNGANTYQFAMSNPVGFIDPYGSVASATGTVTPSTTPGSAPGSGTASATATTGPVNTGISGVSVSGSTTGTLNTNGSYSGAVTATATAKLSNGISASLSATASSFGKLNKNPAIPTLQEQIQAAIMAQLTKNSSLSFICKYQPTNHNYSIGPQSVVSG